MNSQNYWKYSCFCNTIFLIPNDSNEEIENKKLSKNLNKIQYFSSENSFYSFENLKFLSCLKNNWKKNVKNTIYISKRNLLKKIYC
jgi:hypothetical protein